MTNPLSIGNNRTGIEASPFDKSEVLDGAALVPPSSQGDERACAELLAQYAAHRVPVGTVPPPLSLGGVGTVIVAAVKGRIATALFDALGERLAFERRGVRLYEALIAKLDALGSFEHGPTRTELVEIRDEEWWHMRVVSHAIQKLGADPTSVTPSADVTGVATLGLVEVLTDPRTTLGQCLEAMLLAELADNDAWEGLVELAGEFKEHDLVTEFRAASIVEERHVASMRRWVRQAASERAEGEREAA